ncbi:ubiquitin-conjugating enzyme E2s [Basidiobolus meristosporus CBS 931.73]|uniref:Ubiquitin-conjugating enzyme E2s n=1 Tax=Basidiobolus meristosporus CBS 931.73 TaxID=1314790 RepID=A0A1Y1YRQ3_9FUNG|nr:ubiquitin-conjugating enzyme E2s [Basidiobolus meristosporus CBS 931.73]|eukprot:ORY00712.1 ubiquitin-conjugating enzyme E2s [Basidiobolus meristosporus CBS 931.73]
MPVEETHSPDAVRQIIRELHYLYVHPIQDVRIIINENNLFDLQAWIYGSTGTPYANGAFRVKLAFTNEFPRVPPKCYFLTKIFHPNISLTGEVCGSTLNHGWHPDLGISHVLMTLRSLLIQPNLESVMNEEAGELFLDNYEDYAKRAKIMTEFYACRTSYSEEGVGSRKRGGEAKEKRWEKKRAIKRL